VLNRGALFRYQNYRSIGRARHRTMSLAADEFIRSFLVHVLPKGFRRIRHYGLLASAVCVTKRRPRLFPVPNASRFRRRCPGGVWGL
jgi:hypothetical protein